LKEIDFATPNSDETIAALDDADSSTSSTAIDERITRHKVKKNESLDQDLVLLVLWIETPMPMFGRLGPCYLVSKWRTEEAFTTR